LGLLQFFCQAGACSCVCDVEHPFLLLEQQWLEKQVMLEQERLDQMPLQEQCAEVPPILWKNSVESGILIL